MDDDALRAAGGRAGLSLSTGPVRAIIDGATSTTFEPGGLNPSLQRCLQGICWCFEGEGFAWSGV